jgi:hypothetical protein
MWVEPFQTTKIYFAQLAFSQAITQICLRALTSGISPARAAAQHATGGTTRVSRQWP